MSMATNLERAQIDKAFAWRPPSDGQPELYEALRHRAILFALMVADSCPPSREKSLALTKIEEAVMWANAAIARNT